MSDTPFEILDTSEFSDVNCRFKNARFGKVQRYKDNDGGMPTCLILDMEFASGKIHDDQIFSLGGGYKAIDGGASVEHERARFNKPKAAFSKMSKGATLLESLAEIPGAMDMLIDRVDKTGGPRNASFWEGMVVHLVEEVVPFGKPDENGKQKTFKQFKATELFGWDCEIPDDDEDGDTPPPAATAKATAEDFGLSEDQFLRLMAVVTESKDYETFVSEAYGLEIIADAAVQTAVDDDVHGVWGLK